MTRLASAQSEATADPNRDPVTADSDSNASDLDAPDAATRISERGERVKRRELETAIRRLEAGGEVTPAERRVLAVLAERLTDALVERWASKVSDDEVDPEAALALLAE